MKNAMKREYGLRECEARGRSCASRAEKAVTIRLDEEILAWFRRQVERGGGSHQTLIDEVLREHIRRAQEPLEKTLRGVIREEIRRAS